MTLSYNLACQEFILVHPTRSQKPYSTFWNIWDLIISATVMAQTIETEKPWEKTEKILHVLSWQCQLPDYMHCSVRLTPTHPRAQDKTIIWIFSWSWITSSGWKCFALFIFLSESDTHLDHKTNFKSWADFPSFCRFGFAAVLGLI